MAMRGMELKTSVAEFVGKIVRSKGLAESHSVPIEEILLLETHDEHFQK